MEGFGVLVMGLIFLTLVGVGVDGAIYKSDARKLINTCEQNLPRTEKCVLVAVPESEVSDE